MPRLPPVYIQLNAVVVGIAALRMRGVIPDISTHPALSDAAAVGEGTQVRSEGAVRDRFGSTPPKKIVNVRQCQPLRTGNHDCSRGVGIEHYRNILPIRPHSATFGLNNRWAGKRPRYAAFAYQGTDLQRDASGLPREVLYGLESLKGQRPAPTIDASRRGQCPNHPRGRIFGLKG